MLVKTYASAVHGVDAQRITVEVSVGGEIQESKPAYSIVGLPDSAVREGYFRVACALRHSGKRIPRLHIIINLAPADVRKEGSNYDLTTAVGILAATGQIPARDLHRYLIMGELSLDGSLRPIKGALPIAIQGRKEGFEGIILPKANAREAAIVDKLKVYGVEHLREVIDFFSGRKKLQTTEVDTRAEFAQQLENPLHDFADVKGQHNIKRALEIAAAGGHNVVLVGPPGAGKTMLARRLPSILPPLSLREALETTKIHSVIGLLPSGKGLITDRPFRSPHHTISDVALVGGGVNPRPGEISLAHNGVLFLDELPEFKRGVLEVLRQPMESRAITISRAKITVDYPASFMLVAAMNPCPCGYYNHPERDCMMMPCQAKKYLNKISGPLMDRIDLQIEVTPVSYDEFYEQEQTESSAAIRKRVVKARQIQEKRFEENKSLYCNAHLSSKLLRKYCQLDEAGKLLLKGAMERQKLSTRAHDRILKVARTIADLAGSEQILSEHIAEAIQYRSLDREDWAS